MSDVSEGLYRGSPLACTDSSMLHYPSEEQAGVVGRHIYSSRSCTTLQRPAIGCRLKVEAELLVSALRDVWAFLSSRAALNGPQAPISAASASSSRATAEGAAANGGCTAVEAHQLSQQGNGRAAGVAADMVDRVASKGPDHSGGLIFIPHLYIQPCAEHPSKHSRTQVCMC